MGTRGQSITLANSIIGVGILAMPFCFQQCGVLLATLILLLMGLVSRLCCYFLLKSALLARRRNFEFLAFHVFGSAGKIAVEVGIIGFLMGTCIAYFVVVGDLGPQIIAKMFNINQSDILRTSIMVLVSLVCILPLGLLRNVDSLSNVSAATIGFYFCLVIKVIAEAGSQLLAGDWSARLDMWKPQGVLQCVPIFSMALFCQTQLFEIFESLPTLSLEKMSVVTKNAINICTSVYFTLGLFGYIAFCKQDISGNILMSLSPTMASDVIKLGFVMSLAFSFPLIIFPCRASLYSFLYKKVHSSSHDHIVTHSIPLGAFRALTVGIVGGALGASLLLPNVELVLGLLGSTVGVLVCVVFPAACFVYITTKDTNERVLAKAIVVLGLVIMVLGTYANLQAAENSPDKYDDKHITQERIDKIVEDFFQAKKLENEGIIKAPVKAEPIKHEKMKNGKEAVADSAVQPPNPVPPESQPIEKDNLPAPNPEKPKPDEKKPNEETKQLAQEVDKVSETHPRNLNRVSDAKRSQSEEKKGKQIETPKMEVAKPTDNQQNIDLIKQEKLIETIKAHGEEQKELIKEQKEILHNILKTKQELQQNNNDAKKIAVESIQKIANMAIQSLSGGSEPPAVEKKMEPVGNANEAVMKIADVAVEAINEIKDKPEPAAIADENKIQNVAVPVQNVNTEVKQNEPTAQNPIPKEAVKKIADVAVEAIKQIEDKPPVVPGNINQMQDMKAVPAQNINKDVVGQNNAIVQNSIPNEAVKKISDVAVEAIKHIEDKPAAAPVNAGNVGVNQIQDIKAVPAQNTYIDAGQNNPIGQNSIPNEAVKKIADVAVEAIKQIDDKPADAPVNAGNVGVNQIQDIKAVPAQNINKGAGQNNPIAQNPNPLVQNHNNLASEKAQDLVEIKSPEIRSNTIDKQVGDILPQANDASLAQQVIQNTVLQEKPQDLENKNHVHLPDEPQSYKEGEDAQKRSETRANILNNVPLPIAMNEGVQKSPEVKHEIVRNPVEILNSLHPPINNVIVNNNDNSLPVRQKREVVDCTNEASLRLEDKEICKNSKVRDSQEILPKVDLNDALPKALPLVDLSMVHHLRSLKSHDSEKRR